MNHLTPDELVDGVDGTLASDRRAHLDACAECRRHADDVRLTLQAVQQSEVPEPSPLFWTHFADRVRGAMADEAAPAAAGLPAWAGWRVAVPLAALALLVAALINAVPREPQAPAVTPVALADGSMDNSDPGSPAEDAAVDDVSWQLFSDLAEDVVLDEESHGGFLVSGSVERAAADLDPAERAELLRLLRAELGRPES